MFYGKISLGKERVFPISIAALGEIGMIDYSVKTLPYFAAGIGNKFFFNKHWALNIDMRVMYRDAIDPMSQNLSTNPSRDSFSAKWRLNTGLNLGVVYLF
jgi:outer membrane beta-barrel protein